MSPIAFISGGRSLRQHWTNHDVRLSSLLGLVLLLMIPSQTFAHAIVIDASPAIDASVAAGDVPIRLHFNSRIDRPRSKLTLFSPDGKELVLKTDASSPPENLNAAAQGLTTGKWRLRWQVLSVDGHITRGDIPFTVH